MPGPAVGARDAAVNQTDNPVLVAGKRGSPSLSRLCVRDVNMTHTEREREAMQWVGRGMHLINHLVLSLPLLHILLESLLLMWLRDILQSQRIAGAWALSCFYWK